MMEACYSPMKTRSMLGQLVGKLSGMGIDENNPRPVFSRDVKRRLKALKSLEYETIKQEMIYYERVHDLDLEFQEKIAHLEQSRSNIISGIIEPKDDEYAWSTDESDDNEDNPNDAVAGVSETSGEKGIPNFWLTLLDGRAFLVDQIQEHDRPILKHLTNIRVVYLPRVKTGQASRLEFTFSPNNYFSNVVLCKEYHYDLSPSTVRGKKLTYYGPRNVAVFGCPINWKERMDVTKIPYSQELINGGYKDSFFNMFARSGVLGPDLDDDLSGTLEAEFAMCRMLQQTILPRAASIYTNNYYCDILEDEGVDDDDEMYDEEADADYDPKLE